ncbi:hypothetical protein O6H91_17G036200 [Diphasiastrum complanatum]|uniref:Uncharacterized protein n=1 Tax=Diphasiastrum complanatum TaxID=34168 RepID=A0ACC2B5S0_DIPCM|nr:hypothetical protein O6H91_17G036200 [Diphasiastrum complanatum]
MEADRQCSNTISECGTIFVTNSMHSCHLQSLKTSGQKRVQEVASINQGTGLFELLAAVAGELLQDGNIGKVDQNTKLRRFKRIKKQLKVPRELPAEAVNLASSPASSTRIPSSNESVKLSIKSFNVPELLIDLPESATVASLKNAVMDATTNLLSGGLRVRVYLNGSKVRDENATLAQVGISHVEKLNSLKFMLEPTPPLSSGDPLHMLSNAAAVRPFPLYQSDKAHIHGNGHLRRIASRRTKFRKKKRHAEAATTQAPRTHLPKNAQNDVTTFCQREVSIVPGFPKHCTISFPVEEISVPPCSTNVACVSSLAPFVTTKSRSFPCKQDGSTSSTELDEQYPGVYSMAPGIMVQHPDNVVEAMHELGLMAIKPKPLLLDGSKRRMRRPFSIGEVEALVFAVEKLGLGRWRDVKLWAFDQAKHRTYVDLKDKWKTLVHTARIAPHQRRGEPVPEELLERVIQAHTYWTMQQAKEQAEL